MEEYLTVACHNEYAARIDAENNRQNHRIDNLEASVKEFGAISKSVERLAVSMENMTEEQKKQGARLDKIEEKPQKRVETVITEIIKYAVVFALGALIMRFGVTL